MADNDVRIKLSLDGDRKVSSGLAGVGDSADQADSKLGRLAKGGLKGAGVALVSFAGAASVAGGALVKGVLNQTAQYEQNIGGIETMFKGSAAKMEQYAADAYRTAGLSANEYMSQATSFSAALLQGLGGDTDKAAEIANRAMTDMSDNANKFGTNIGMIQNAYQGFSKQNFTMLDNLKLGYGGTASEMARLVNDAGLMEDGFVATAKNINEVSYDKIIASIGAVQDKMGITGTTAKEAASTISGSVATLQGAWSNLLAGLGSADADVATLAGNVITSMETVLTNVTPVIDNIGSNLATLGPKLGEMTSTLAGTVVAAIPQIISAGTAMIGGLLSGISAALPQLAGAIVPAITGIVGMVAEQAPALLAAGIQAIFYLGQGLVQALPTLIPMIVQLVAGLSSQIINALPVLLSTGLNIIMALGQGLIQALPTLIAMLPQLILGIVDFIVGAIPQLIETGITLFVSLIQALPDIITTIVAALPQIIESIISGLLGAIPLLIEAGITLLISLVEALPQIISGIVQAIPQIISAVINAVIGAIPQLIQAGIDLFVALITNLPTIIGTIVGAIPQIISGIIGALMDGIPKMVSMGGDLIRGLWQGIQDLGGWIMGQIQGFMGNIVGGIKSFFGIASPSKVTKKIGHFVAQGFAVGFKKGEAEVKRAADSLIGKIRKAIDAKAISRGRGNSVIQYIQRQTADLSKAIRAYEKSVDRVKDARDKLADMRGERWDFIGSTRESVIGSVSLADNISTDSMEKGLKERTKAVNEFQKKLDRLQKWGIDDATRNDFLEAFLRDGTTRGVDVLLAGGKAEVKSIAELQRKLSFAGGKLGTTAADDMFNAGIQAQEGLYRGLLANSRRLDSVAKTLADRLTRAVKKGLGIRSPSRVFDREVGRMLPAGLGRGVLAAMPLALKPLRALSDKVLAEATRMGMLDVQRAVEIQARATILPTTLATSTPSYSSGSGNAALVAAIEDIFTNMPAQTAMMDAKSMDMFAGKVAQAIVQLRYSDNTQSALAIKQGVR